MTITSLPKDSKLSFSPRPVQTLPPLEANPSHPFHGSLGVLPETSRLNEVLLPEFPLHGSVLAFVLFYNYHFTLRYASTPCLGVTTFTSVPLAVFTVYYLQNILSQCWILSLRMGGWFCPPPHFSISVKPGREYDPLFGRPHSVGFF